MSIYFVSLISRESQPLYIQPFSPYGNDIASSETPDPEKDQKANELLKYNFLSHMALDVFESPFTPLAESEQQPGRNHQLLFVQDGVYIFGQETNTGLKIVVGCSANETSGKSLNQVFKQVHKAYLRLICNPFLGTDKVDEEIQSPTFDKKVKEIVEWWNGVEGKA